MFVCTFNEEKKIDLENKGFNLVCKQKHGDKICYTFNFNPSFYALFSNDKEVFVSDKMLMA
ncbi:MAG: hypothetical protein ACRC7S_18625 [Cetobacterium sp.]